MLAASCWFQSGTRFHLFFSALKLPTPKYLLPPPPPSFFSPLFLFNPFSLLVCPQEGCFPSLPHKSKAACVEGAVTGVKHDATLNGPRGGGRKSPICTHNICMFFSEEEGRRERCSESRQSSFTDARIRKHHLPP